MGERIESEVFDAGTREVFRRRLEDSLVALDAVLKRPGFGAPADTIGAELEMFLVTDDGVPAPLNTALLTEADDDRLTHEVGRFNMELNLTPQHTANRPFSGLEGEIVAVQDLLAEVGKPFGARAVFVGILPTLGLADLARDAMTEVTRYRVIDRILRRRRNGSPFRISISGPDHCDIEVDSIAVQAACCSWQVHLTAIPDRLAATYDAVQMITAPLLAVSGNSPLLLGRRLWQETRVALYEQGMGDRATAAAAGSASRVSFGTEWKRGGRDVFEDAVRDHDVLVPEVSDEEPLAVVRRGRIPRLRELRLHQSTVWRWNRPVYDPAGNVRVEVRALPSGPTAVDMAANTAFLAGLTGHLVATGGDFTAGLSFEAARENFYRAAAVGPAAVVRWPFPGGVREVAAADLVTDLLPAATDGLRALGVDHAEAERYLSVVERRAATGRTGARWQRLTFEALREHGSSERALRELVRRYAGLSTSNQPVHTWPSPSRGAAW
ncbi:glutamate--cysteine ligase [Actinosynnema sp. NPDC050436]|uniref:glutamate--cysteine ligase n=1 Tax=Actinosynnema sp. NPDC050436 TaxID=3155659 RepID=UPI0033DC9F7C